jgi:ribosomal protein L34E
MGRKRKASLPWCYYCGREFEDEKVLLLHQRAKHFRCGSCAKQFGNVGTMRTHALKAHGETVAKARVGGACAGVARWCVSVSARAAK